MPLPLPHLSPRESLLADIGRVRDLIEAKEYARARELATRILVNAKAAGIESAQATWMAAVSADYADDLEAALVAATEAVRLDPLSPEYQNSLEFIARRARQALAVPDRAWDDPSTPRLCGLLVKVDLANGPSLLQNVRFLYATGTPHEALRALDALTLRWPVYAAAWELMADIAREVGDERRLAEAETRVNGTCADTMPLSPGREPRTSR